MTVFGIKGRIARRRLRPAVDMALCWWIGTGLTVIVIFLLSGNFGYLSVVEPEQAVPVAVWIKAAMAWLTDHTRLTFRSVTWLLAWPLAWVRGILQWLPWSATLLLCALLGFVAGGWRLAAFCGIA
ncbi:MAG: hypothetical protein ACREEV_11620, partial [Dongiaceae bacterium]